MKEDLLKYMSMRSKKDALGVKEGGPVITISREKGCPANTIAEKLAEKMSAIHHEKWRSMNREIIEKSARELHVNPSKINHVIYSEDKGFFRDLMHSFGEKYYESDVHIKKTLADLITKFAQKGRVIIVGIGSVAITKNMTKSLHVKLSAPYKDRLKSVMKLENMDAEEAREYMDETDVNRKMLIDYFNGLKAHNDLFHVHYNTSLLSEDEIVDSILEMAKNRRLV